MALEQIQGKAGSLTPDELDRLALQYKPSWEMDFPAITPVVAVAAVPQANGAHANGNGAASHAQTEVADKPKFAASAPAGAPRAASIKATVMGTGSLADAPPVVDEAPPPAPPAPPIEAAAVEAPQASAPAENAVAEVAEKEAISPAAAALEVAAPPAEDNAPKEITEAGAEVAPPLVANEAGLSETTAAVVAEQAEAAHETTEEKAQAKPVPTIVENSAKNVANDVANAEPLDAIPMQSSSSGTIMKVVFALVAIVGLAFVGKGMLGGSDKDKPKPTTNSQAAATPTETATAKPDQPSGSPTETAKPVEAAPEVPKSVKTDAPKPADAPKGETKTAEAPKAETPKVEIPKVETPKPVVTATAVTKATVAIAPKPPPAPAPAPTPKPTTTATAKTGGGIIRETPF